MRWRRWVGSGDQALRRWLRSDEAAFTQYAYLALFVLCTCWWWYLMYSTGGEKQAGPPSRGDVLGIVMPLISGAAFLCFGAITAVGRLAVNADQRSAPE